MGAGILIARFAPWFGTGVSGLNILYIIIWNLVAFVILDLGKVLFRHLIGDGAGEIIASDELIEPTTAKKIDSDDDTDVDLMERNMRRNYVMMYIGNQL